MTTNLCAAKVGYFREDGDLKGGRPSDHLFRPWGRKLRPLTSLVPKVAQPTTGGV